MFCCQSPLSPLVWLLQLANLRRYALDAGSAFFSILLSLQFFSFSSYIQKSFSQSPKHIWFQLNWLLLYCLTALYFLNPQIFHCFGKQLKMRATCGNTGYWILQSDNWNEEMLLFAQNQTQRPDFVTRTQNDVSIWNAGQSKI